MNKPSLIICFLLIYSSSYSQLPEVFQLDMDCSATYESYVNGIYTKSEVLGPVLTNDGVGACGCWDKDGTDEFLLVFDSGGEYIMVHYPDPEGEGCAGATDYGPSYVSVSNPSGDCILENFTVVTNGAISNSCSSSFTLREYIAPIPTLSQWGIMVLGMVIMILGIVGIKNRKVIFE